MSAYANVNLSQDRMTNIPKFRQMRVLIKTIMQSFIEEVYENDRNLIIEHAHVEWVPFQMVVAMMDEIKDLIDIEQPVELPRMSYTKKSSKQRDIVPNTKHSDLEESDSDYNLILGGVSNVKGGRKSCRRTHSKLRTKMSYKRRRTKRT